MSLRIGVDLVDVAAFRARFEGREDLLAATFTEAELAYCRAQADPWPHLAARLAAREALLKALGTGLSGELDWHECEVVRDAAGTPALALRGAVAEAAAGAGLGRWTVSLAHTATHAVAVVLFAG